MTIAAKRFTQIIHLPDLGSKASVPADRLIVWTPKDGWEPLCEALGVPVPDEPLPHAFDTEVFRSAITGGAVKAVADYWAKAHPEG